MRSLPVRGVRCFAVITVALQVAAGAAAHMRRPPWAVISG